MFDGYDHYGSYSNEVKLWIDMTTRLTLKHVPEIVGCLYGEAEPAAKANSTEAICKEGGVDLILKCHDKAYAVDKTNQLEAGLADFLDYSWRKYFSVKHFISRFHTRVDKISSLNLDDKLNSHLLLRQTNLTYYDKNVVVAAASGSYDVSRISAALSNMC